MSCYLRVNMRRPLLLQTTKLLKNEVSRAEAELYNLLEWDFIDQPPKTFSVPSWPCCHRFTNIPLVLPFWIRAVAILAANYLAIPFAKFHFQQLLVICFTDVFLCNIKRASPMLLFLLPLFSIPHWIYCMDESNLILYLECNQLHWWCQNYSSAHK